MTEATLQPRQWYTWDREARQMLPCAPPSPPRDQAAIEAREARMQAELQQRVRVRREAIRRVS